MSRKKVHPENKIDKVRGVVFNEKQDELISRALKGRSFSSWARNILLIEAGIEAGDELEDE